MVYADGLRRWHWRGLLVERRLIENPETITVSEIESQGNLELRRCLLERYGMDRYLSDSGANEVQRDEYGVLYRHRDMAFVLVENGSTEADGTRRKYVIGVDPQSRTAHEAVASTYGMTASEYAPEKRT